MSGQNIIIINRHAPIKDKDKEAKDAFYAKLERLYDSLPRCTIKIIMGNINVKIGGKMYLGLIIMEDISQILRCPAISSSAVPIFKETISTNRHGCPRM